MGKIWSNLRAANGLQLDHDDNDSDLLSGNWKARRRLSCAATRRAARVSLSSLLMQRGRPLACSSSFVVKRAQLSSCVLGVVGAVDRASSSCLLCFAYARAHTHTRKAAAVAQQQARSRFISHTHSRLAATHGRCALVNEEANCSPSALPPPPLRRPIQLARKRNQSEGRALLAAPTRRAYYATSSLHCFRGLSSLGVQSALIVVAARAAVGAPPASERRQLNGTRHLQLIPVARQRRPIPALQSSAHEQSESHKLHNPIGRRANTWPRAAAATHANAQLCSGSLFAFDSLRSAGDLWRH